MLQIIIQLADDCTDFVETSCKSNMIKNVELVSAAILIFELWHCRHVLLIQRMINSAQGPRVF